MRQRIMIAIALLHEPSLLIADEATSALDVTLEAQILKLLKEINAVHGTAILLISHNLGVIAEVCERVVVMYAGRAVEEGDVYSIFDRPLHPYTRALLAAVPSPQHRGTTLAAIPGRVPSLLALPPGCKYADRCAHAVAVCFEREPGSLARGGLRVRCFLYDDSLPEADKPRADWAKEPVIGMTADPPRGALLSVRDLQTFFSDRQGVIARLLRRKTGEVRAVDGVSFDVVRGETLGLVGESGSGKSTLARTVMGLVPATGGSASLDGRELVGLGRREWRPLRRRIQMIFQDPELEPVAAVPRVVPAPGALRHQQGPARPAVERGRAARHGRPLRRAGRQVPARAVGRAGAPRLHRAGPGPASRSALRRRADGRSRRVGGGEHPQPHEGSAGPPRPHLRPHHPRSQRRRVLRRPHRRDVRRPARSRSVSATGSWRIPGIRTRRRCSRAPPSPTPTSTRGISTTSSAGRSRALTTRLRAAASTRAASTRTRGARTRSRGSTDLGEGEMVACHHWRQIDLSRTRAAAAAAAVAAHPPSEEGRSRDVDGRHHRGRHPSRLPPEQLRDGRPRRRPARPPLLLLAAARRSHLRPHRHRPGRAGV